MKKNYVLDTNVLLHDPHAIFKFEDNDVIIPIFAIEEIDQFKREGSERGRNARTIARLLDELRRDQDTSLAKGVPLESGGILRIAIPEHRPDALVGLRVELAGSRPSSRRRSTCATATRRGRPSSSPWTRTSASAPTRWG